MWINLFNRANTVDNLFNNVDYVNNLFNYVDYVDIMFSQVVDVLTVCQRGHVRDCIQSISPGKPRRISSIHHE